MNKNIQFKILNFCNGLVFFAPVATLLRTSRGVTLSQFFLLQALLSVMIFIFEIPTGMLTDRIGYKRGIFVSQLLLFMARAVFLFANHLIYFVIEAALEAFSCCLMSGTKDAYLYEICKADGNKDNFMKESAKVNAWGTAGFLISTVVYVFIYHYFDLNGLVIATELATIVSIVAVICMPATEMHMRSNDNKTWSFPRLPKILWKFMMFDAMIGLTGLIINFLYVEKLTWSGIPVAWMTPIILAYSALDLLVPKVLKLLSKTDDAKIYRLFSMFAGAFLIAIFIANHYVSVAFMMLTPFLLNIVGMIQYNYENIYIDQLGEENNRATLLSMINMGNNLLEIIFLFMSAIISSGQGNAMFLFAGVIMFVLAMFGSKLVKKKE